MIAELGAALRLFLEFLRCRCPVVRMLARASGLRRGAGGAPDLRGPRPALRRLILSALTSKRAHVGDCRKPSRPPKGAGNCGWELRSIGTGDYRREEWQPQGPLLGWRDGDVLYLDPEAAYAMASRLSGEQGRALGVASKTLGSAWPKRGCWP